MGLGSRGTQLACIALRFTGAALGFVTGAVKAQGGLPLGFLYPNSLRFTWGFN